MKLKLLSWNIWEKCNFEELKEFLKEKNADILCLQEVLVDDQTRDINSFLKDLGYSSAIGLSTSLEIDNKIISIYNGVFSKNKIVKSFLHPISEKIDRGVVEAVIKIDDKMLHVFSVHLKHTHQQNSEFQNQQTDILISVIPDMLSVVMGDFNSTPNSYPINKMKREMIDTDTSSKPTWCLYEKGCPECKLSEIKLKLDYIFLSRDIKFQNFEVGNSKASDHLPILVDIEI
jgi:endonuclease/exonuclease/phosphatase family metal-dependent hydrolase